MNKFGPDMYDADYFLRGKQTGKSLYTNYRWLPDLTKPMVASIISHLGIQPDDTILDFGCARGYVVRAFRELGYSAWGMDISKWALDNADPTVRKYLISTHDDDLAVFDWVIAKDVLEHVGHVDDTIEYLKGVANKGVFAVVPLAESTNGNEYDVKEYDMDVTHIHRCPLYWWVSRFHEPGWSVEARYRVRGVKDNYAQYPTGNGFVTCRRLSDS